VDLAAPTPAPSALAGCAALSDALPESLESSAGELGPRETATDLVTAWGDPAVTLECGVPGALLEGPVLTLGPPDAPTLGFLTDDVGAATAYTTGTLATDVRVTVPDAYDATLLVDLVPLLRRHLG
jgi:hypothetical protein